jgi:hypothetical protein
MNKQNVVELKNGSKEAESLVQATIFTLKSLKERNPIALYELVQIARNKDHIVFGNLDEELKRLNLIDHNGTMHSSIRNIILSAFKGDDFEMVFVSPIA